MKKFITVFIICLLMIPMSCFAEVKTYDRTRQKPLVPKDVLVNDDNINDIMVTPAISSKDKIYDFANLFSKEEEKKLYDSIKEYIDYSDIDVAIVATKDLVGFTTEDYAYNFYDYNDFKSDGVILVIYIGEKEPELYMGNSGDTDGKVFTIYNKVMIGETLKYIYKDIKAGNYYTAVDNYVKILKGFFNKDRGGNYRVNENGEIVKNLPWLEILTLSISLTFILVMIFVFRNRGEKQLLYQSNIDNYINNDSMIIQTEKDELIETSVSKKK